MIAPTQIKKPENWQDFEMLCKKLWGEIWDCSNTIKRNGRSGQKQCGVDVYGVPKGEDQYFGIQCKGKDDYSNSVLTTAEIDSEIIKAKEFKPALKQFIFTTTANKDVSIEEYVRLKDIENRQNGLFEVYLFCWEDIVDLLEERQNTYNWYVNNCQYKDSTDISVTFDGQQVVVIHPEYIHKTITYKLREKDPWTDFFQQSHSIVPTFSPLRFNEPRKFDYRWCKVNLNIENTGSTVIKDYKLYFGVDADCIDGFSAGIQYENNILISDIVRSDINRKIDENREVYPTKYSNLLQFIPNNSILVQTDNKSFSFKVLPKDKVEEIVLFWDFKSQNYNKQGKLVIKVEPKYDYICETKLVDNVEDLKEPQVTINAKIVEK